MRHVSSSQIVNHKRCGRIPFFEKVWELERDDYSQARSIGTAYHDVLDVYHKSDTEFALMELNNKLLAFTAEESELLTHMVTGYFDFDKEKKGSSLSLEGDKIWVEEEWSTLEFGDIGGVILMCRPDLVVRRGRDILVVEHKTAANPWTLEQCIMHTQGKINCYVVGSNMEDYDSLQMVFNIAYKQFPKPPKINKDGTVSRAACVTTEALYLAAIESVNGDPVDYRDALMKVREYKFHERMSVTYSRKGTQSMIVKALKDMNRNRSELPLGSEDFMCPKCSYYDICLTGQDDEREMLKYVRQTGLIKEV